MARLTQITAVAMSLLLTGCSTFSSIDGCKSIPPAPAFSGATTSASTESIAVPCAVPTSPLENGLQRIEDISKTVVRAGERAVELASVVEKLINAWKALINAFNR